MTDYTKYKPGDVTVDGLIEECPLCHKPGRVLREIMAPFWAVVMHNTDNLPGLGWFPKPGMSTEYCCVPAMNDGRVTESDFINGTGPADKKPIGLFHNQP